MEFTRALAKVWHGWR